MFSRGICRRRIVAGGRGTEARTEAEEQEDEEVEGAEEAAVVVVVLAEGSSHGRSRGGCCLMIEAAAATAPVGVEVTSSHSAVPTMCGYNYYRCNSQPPPER